MRIVIDMNLSPDWIETLRVYGYQAVHWSSVGDPRAADSEILAWAKTNAHVLFTHDLDFGAILAGTRADSPSVIQVRAQNVLPDHLGPLIANAFSQFDSELTAGALITI